MIKITKTSHDVHDASNNDENMKHLVTLSHDIECHWKESLRHLLQRKILVIGEAQANK
jgi:hypothetical protein